VITKPERFIAAGLSSYQLVIAVQLPVYQKFTAVNWVILLFITDDSGVFGRNARLGSLSS
jgi:hypothetical protein